MSDKKCDCPGCNCTIKEGEHSYAVHGKHYCCEACAHHHKHGEEWCDEGLRLRSSEISAAKKSGA